MCCSPSASDDSGVCEQHRPRTDASDDLCALGGIRQQRQPVAALYLSPGAAIRSGHPATTRHNDDVGLAGHEGSVWNETQSVGARPQATAEYVLPDAH